ncbi:hypothetical protein [Pseudomonas sp. SDO52101_S400]
MKKSIIDQTWHKIADLDSQGRAAAATKLEQVVELARRIGQTEGGEVANNVLEHGLIEVALLRSRQIQDRELGLDYDDLQIYYRYATNAMKNAEKVIDNELAHLDL